MSIDAIDIILIIEITYLSKSYHDINENCDIEEMIKAYHILFLMRYFLRL